MSVTDGIHTLGPDSRMAGLIKKIEGQVRQSGCHDIQIEHVALALIDDPELEEFFNGNKIPIYNIRESLSSALVSTRQYQVPSSSDDPVPSTGVEALFDAAAALAHRNGDRAVSPFHVLLALLRRPEGIAPAAFAAFGAEEEMLSEYIVSRHREPSTIITRLPALVQNRGLSGFRVYGGGTALRDYTVNLTQRAQDRTLDPVIGREDLIEKGFTTLRRRGKANPLFVGEPGSGRHSIVNAMAMRLVNDPPPGAQFRDANIFALDVDAIVAGTSNRGDLEKRFKDIVKEIKEIPNAILFIANLESTKGAGASREGPNDVSSLLRIALSTPGLRTIGLASTEGYYKHIEKDPGFRDQFYKIDVPEASKDACYSMMMAASEGLEKHHGISFTPEARKACTDLSHRHLHGRVLPGKAVDVADQAAASCFGRESVTLADVEAVVAEMANIPAATVGKDEAEKLRTLKADLDAVVFGQERVTAALQNALWVARSGQNRPNKPIGNFLFSGPTGVGKTEIAKKLAEILGVPLIRFDMSEFDEKHSVARLKGAPPGYVGYGASGELTNSVRKNPYSVLLLDEVEKAHPDVFNVLLATLDDGRMTDGEGRTVDFTNTIIIMTTNAGAQAMDKAAIGFTNKKDAADNHELKNLFRPEFWNRLSGHLQFRPIDPVIIRKVAEKSLGELSGLLEEKKIIILPTPPVLSFLAREGIGFDRKFGARPMYRAVTEHIKTALAPEILFGRLKQGGTVRIDFAEAANDNPLPDNVKIQGSLSFTFEGAVTEARPAVSPPARKRRRRPAPE